MKTPSQKQFQVVIDNLEKANKMAKGTAKIDMMEGAVKGCGTPMCHGGWYAIIKGMGNYTEGSYEMSKDLGFSPANGLIIWAKENPEIWGNRYGSLMFCDGLAFGKKQDTGFTLTTIINHWKGVKQRAAKLG